jgi:hypothetical protein
VFPGKEGEAELVLADVQPKKFSISSKQVTMSGKILNLIIDSESLAFKLLPVEYPP